MASDAEVEQTQSWSELVPALAPRRRSSATTSAPLAIGGMVAGRFELRERLGAGGMGVVFRAFDQELEEVVALKVLHPQIRDAGASLSGLRREVRAARRVASPHVARMYELHYDSDLAFLVMEFVDGFSLAAWMEAGARQPAVAMAIALDVGRGLAAAHACGIVHRDVKPANVMLRRDGTALLTDFGLAHVLAPGSGGATLGAVGTPAYMAPEQALGQRVGPAADVFALGVMVHELLSGGLPWSGRTALEMALARIHEAPAALTPIQGVVDRTLADWVQRALQRDPALRWPDGATALAALEAAVRPLLEAKEAPRLPVGGIPPGRPVSARGLPLVWLQPFGFRRGTGEAALAEVAEDACEDAAARLGAQRGLRLLDGDPLCRRLEAGEDADAIARSVGASLRVLVRLSHRRDGLRAHLRVVAVDGGEVVASATLDVADADVESLGDALAERIGETIGVQLSARGDAPSRASAEEAVIAMARRNLCSLDPARLDVAAALLQNALKPRPGDLGLRVFRAWALAQHWHASGAIRPDRLAELQAALPTLRADPELPSEALHALAQLHYLVGDVVAAARVARRAVAAAPSVPFAHELLGRMLLDCDAGDEGLARLAAAARVAPLRLPARLARCQWFALAADWERHDAELAAVRPEPAERHLLWTWQLRAALWRDDRGALGQLRDQLRHQVGVNADDPHFALLQSAVGAALGEGSCDVATRLASLRSPLATASSLELCAELHAARGQVDAALIAATAAVGAGALGLAWLRRCPHLGALRGAPGMRAAREGLEARAAAVRAALHEVDSAP